MKIAHTITATFLLGLGVLSASVRFDMEQTSYHSTGKTTKLSSPRLVKSLVPESIEDRESGSISDQWPESAGGDPEVRSYQVKKHVSEVYSAVAQDSIVDDVLVEPVQDESSVGLSEEDHTQKISAKKGAEHHIAHTGDVEESYEETTGHSKEDTQDKGKEDPDSEEVLDKIIAAGPIDFSEVAFGKDHASPTIQTGQPGSILGRTQKRVKYREKLNHHEKRTQWELDDMRRRNKNFMKARHMDFDAALVAAGKKNSNSEMEERDSDPDTWIVPGESFSLEYPAWERRFSDGEQGLKYYNEWIYASEVLESGEWSMEESMLMGEDDLMVRRVGVLNMLAAPPLMGQVQHSFTDKAGNSATTLRSSLALASVLLSTILLIVI